MNIKTHIKSSSKPVLWVGLLLAASMILAACSAYGQSNQPAAASNSSSGGVSRYGSGPSSSKPASTQPVSASGGATINVATDPNLGDILVDGKGMTLYIFKVDGPDKSNCDANCLAVWPPLVSEGAPTLGAGVDQSMVGSATLADGRSIVTYNHMPLYYYAPDTQPGDTKGQGVGSVWYVISPDGKDVESAASSSSSSAPAAASEPTLNVSSNATLGQFLVDGKGMTLYIFTKDTPDQSNCDASCLAKWPPLLTSGSPILGTGVDDSKVGTAKLADGSTIVTYNHMPLYYFAKDTQPGDTNGQEVGDVWYVISPDGKVIESSSSSSSSSAPAASSEPTLNVASNATLGQFLVDGKGMTLYIFTKDTPDQSNCDASCLAKWPPLLTSGSPILGTGVDDSKVGTAMLADGRTIVTYNHMPLYYFANDTQPGDTNGQGVGSVWYVINPDGEIIGQ